MKTNIQKLTECGYRINTIPTGYAVSDPQDDQDGFYLEVETLEQVEQECDFIE